MSSPLPPPHTAMVVLLQANCGAIERRADAAAELLSALRTDEAAALLVALERELRGARRKLAEAEFDAMLIDEVHLQITMRNALQVRNETPAGKSRA